MPVSHFINQNSWDFPPPTARDISSIWNNPGTQFPEIVWIAELIGVLTLEAAYNITFTIQQPQVPWALICLV